jgi:hypothetical protein
VHEFAPVGVTVIVDEAIAAVATPAHPVTLYGAFPPEIVAVCAGAVALLNVSDAGATVIADPSVTVSDPVPPSESLNVTVHEEFAPIVAGETVIVAAESVAAVAGHVPVVSAYGATPPKMTLD